MKRRILRPLAVIVVAIALAALPLAQGATAVEAEAGDAHGECLGKGYF